MKKILSIFIALAMLLPVGTVFAGATYSDTEGHWAEKYIEAWSKYGVISGYDGQFSPNRSITRGEFAVVLNRLLKYEKIAENRFADLSQDFYTESVLKLYKAGVMQGYENKISPKDSLTREEAAVMICRALGIETQDNANRSFADDAEVSSWSKGYVNAMVNLGLLNGADGKLNPKNSISRAEVVTVLDNAVLPILTSGDYENLDVNKILVVSVGNVNIKSSKINNKLIITQGVKDGKVTFNDSEIKGEVTIDNDREKFIKIDKSTVIDKDIFENTAVIKEEKEESGSSSGGPGGGGPGGGGPGGGGNKDEDPKDPETPDVPETPENPDTPVNPEDPETPVDPENPDTPVNPEDPETPVDPENPDIPIDPENPDTPVNPDTPDTPVDPDTPDTPDTPVDPEDPDIPDNPDTPVEPEEPDTPVEPDEPEYDAEYYKRMNSEMVTNLKLVSDDMAMYLDPSDAEYYSIFTNEEKYIFRKIKACIDDAVTYETTRIIDADFIKSEYETSIEEVQGVYDEMKLRGTSGDFHTKLYINLNSYTLLWLADALDIDLSEYGIEAEDYINM